MLDEIYCRRHLKPNSILFKINWLVLKDLFAVTAEQNAYHIKLTDEIIRTTLTL